MRLRDRQLDRAAVASCSPCAGDGHRRANGGGGAAALPEFGIHQLGGPSWRRSQTRPWLLRRLRSQPALPNFESLPLQALGAQTALQAGQRPSLSQHSIPSASRV